MKISNLRIHIRRHAELHIKNEMSAKTTTKASKLNNSDMIMYANN